ncbi:MAG: site-specific DNA-methyltransferase [Actinomycetota bacterium]|nr:site-specific DNA-methyltransferase [Actinomycetota bacterium]
MPELNWIGKQHVVNHAEEVPFRLLRKQEKRSEGVADSGNMVIHGDNLEALKALLPYYQSRVKLVFIDPPYNTGNEGWSYNDRMNAPKLAKWFGKVVGGEGEDLSRHDKWLCMMYPRLELLRDLLAEDGSLWMTVDDNEAHYAKVLMDEIFGRNNFVANVVWQKRTSPDARIHLGAAHDNVLVYARNAERVTFHKQFLNEEQSAKFKNPDDDPRGPWTSTDFTAQGWRPNQMYEITTPGGATYEPPPGRCWGNVESRFLQLRSEDRLWFGKDGNSRPRIKNYLSEVSGLATWTWWPHKEAGNNQEAKRELNRIMGFAETSETFATPKPVRLLQRILQVATDPDSIVLDSFAGSGTTAHAVLKQNAEDGGERKFVLVEMEDYAGSLTAERVRRVIRGEGGQPYLGDETGFDYYELAGELFTALGERIDPEVDKEALGRFAFFLETGVTLDDGAAGTFGTNGAAFVGGGRDRDLYLFYEPEGTTAFGYEELSALPHPENGKPKVVYADRCLVDDEELEARGVVFRKIPRDLRELMARFGKGRAR